MISTISARSIRHGIYLGRGVVVVQGGVVWQRLFERAFVRTRVRFSRQRLYGNGRAPLSEQRVAFLRSRALQSLVAEESVRKSLRDSYKRGQR